MSLSRGAMLALERHFVGALSAPARTWLEPVPVSQLAFAGSAVQSRAGGCAVDFGTVDSPGREQHFVRVINCGGEPVRVHIDDCPKWLMTRWRGAGGDTVEIVAGAAGETLELAATHDTENRFHGCIRLLVSAGGARRIEDLPVLMTARRAYPIAVFDFNGSPVLRSFDLGNGKRPYRLAVSNNSAVPLVVRFADLPAWLTFEIGNQRRNGPLPGPFFERRAPFSIRLWARASGRQQGEVRIETNDPRPQYRSMVLRLSSSVEAPPSQSAVVTVKSELPNASSMAARKPSVPAGIVMEVAPRQPSPFAVRFKIAGAVALLLFIVFVLIVRGLT